MTPLLLAAAETSKVPFYISGGLLVVWAIVLAGLGLSREEFPNNAAGQRGVIMLTVALVVLAVGTAIATA
jgi:hypothetical protein